MSDMPVTEPAAEPESPFGLIGGVPDDTPAPAPAAEDTVKVQLLAHSARSTFEAGIDGVPTITADPAGVPVPRALLDALSDAAVLSDVTLRLVP
jgi:hypothetical protein